VIQQFLRLVAKVKDSAQSPNLVRQITNLKSSLSSSMT